MVVMENVPEDSPALIVRLPKTFATVELLVTETLKPSAGAGPLRVTVPAELEPPTSMAGLSERPLIPMISIINV